MARSMPLGKISPAGRREETEAPGCHGSEGTDQVHLVGPAEGCWAGLGGGRERPKPCREGPHTGAGSSLWASLSLRPGAAAAQGASDLLMPS